MVKHYSVKFKTDGHFVKVIVAAKNILRARYMMERVYPEMQEENSSAATIRLLCYR